MATMVITIDGETKAATQEVLSFVNAERELRRESTDAGQSLRTMGDSVDDASHKTKRLGEDTSRLGSMFSSARSQLLSYAGAYVGISAATDALRSHMAALERVRDLTIAIADAALTTKQKNEKLGATLLGSTSDENTRRAIEVSQEISKASGVSPEQAGGFAASAQSNIGPLFTKDPKTGNQVRNEKNIEMAKAIAMVGQAYGMTDASDADSLGDIAEATGATTKEELFDIVGRMRSGLGGKFGEAFSGLGDQIKKPARLYMDQGVSREDFMAQAIQFREGAEDPGQAGKMMVEFFRSATGNDKGTVDRIGRLAKSQGVEGDVKGMTAAERMEILSRGAREAIAAGPEAVTKFAATHNLGQSISAFQPDAIAAGERYRQGAGGMNAADMAREIEAATNSQVAQANKAAAARQGENVDVGELPGPRLASELRKKFSPDQAAFLAERMKYTDFGILTGSIPGSASDEAVREKLTIEELQRSSRGTAAAARALGRPDIAASAEKVEGDASGMLQSGLNPVYGFNDSRLMEVIEAQAKATEALARAITQSNSRGPATDMGN